MNMHVDKPSLREYQVADLAFYLMNKKCMNLSDPGVGKTPSVVVYLWYLWNELGVGSAWVMPKRLLDKNRREILRFTEFGEEDVVVLDGTAKQIERKLQSGAKVYLMGFRRWALSWRNLPRFVKAVPVDEFHKGFKSPNSQTTLALFESFDSGRMEYFLPMTGTLVSGKLTSAYPAIRIIEPRYYPSAEAFEWQHAIKDPDGKIIGWQNHGKLSAILGTHAIRRTFESVHGRQDPIIIPEVVKMSQRQRAMYDEFHEKAILDLERFYLDGTEPGVAFIRARQLMEHPNRFPDLTNPGQFIDALPGEVPGKLELLDIHLDDHENTGKPLIIYTSMIPQQMQVADLLKKRGFRYGVINGGLSIKESDRVAKDFEDGKLDVMLSSEECADVGFNWQHIGDQELDHIIFMTMGYLDTTFLQAVRRAIRGKRASPLRVSVFEYEDSIDQHVFGIVYKKSLDAHKVDPTRPVLQLSGAEKDYSIKEF